MAKITNKLLQEAIADAEAVRETAVANAKLVLEEAITPQIREMIARRLRVEAMEGEEEGEVEEAAKEVPQQDAKPVGGKDFPADSSDVGKGDNKEPSDDSNHTSKIGDGGENKEDSSTDWYDDWSESDFDLDEVIKELEEDIARLTEKKGEAPEGEHEEEHEEEKEEMKEGWAEEGTGKDSQTFAHAAAPTAEEKEEKEEEEEEGEEEELDLEAILAELEDEEEEDVKIAKHDAVHHAAPSKDAVMAEKIARIKALQQELAQYREAVEILRGQLHEVRLLNAKLLYTNKLFRKDLSNEQKVSIVESFDRATTLREVKIVYTTLAQNMGPVAKAVSPSRKKVVTEGFASKATPSTAPKKEVISEVSSVAKRLQELAGIL
jgi:hypothetical protein